MTGKTIEMMLERVCINSPGSLCVVRNIATREETPLTTTFKVCTDPSIGMPILALTEKRKDCEQTDALGLYGSLKRITKKDPANGELRAMYIMQKKVKGKPYHIVREIGKVEHEDGVVVLSYILE